MDELKIWEDDNDGIENLMPLVYAGVIMLVAMQYVHPIIVIILTIGLLIMYVYYTYGN